MTKAASPGIRAATADDLPAIIELWKPFMDHHAAIDAHYARTPEAHERFAEYLLPLMGNDDHAIFVAEDGGRIVGFAKASLAEYPPIVRERAYGSITDMAVAEGHRRKGVGRLLLGACEAWLKGRGVSRIEVRVLTGNAQGERFWSSQGYREFLSVKWKRI